jgi:hypothetical protein
LGSRHELFSFGRDGTVVFSVVVELVEPVGKGWADDYIVIIIIIIIASVLYGVRSGVLHGLGDELMTWLREDPTVVDQTADEGNAR